jgi:hypothetical protein
VGQDRSGEGGAGVRRRVSQHGTGTVAPGRSDSSGWCTSRGRGGRNCDRGEGGRERREAQRMTSGAR